MTKFKGFIGKKSLSLVLLAVLVVTAFTGCTQVDVVTKGDVPAEEPVFSVSVPVTLPVTITEDGEVLTSDAAVITNNSEGPVVIKEVQITGVDGWDTVAYGTDMQIEKVDTKVAAVQLIFGDELSGTIVSTTGANNNDYAKPIRIEKGESLSLTYKVEVPAQTKTYESIEAFKVDFILDWAE